MPVRDSFNCLWCGRAWTVRDVADIEGWAQLCPDCVGRAGENGFLRFRLKTALAERARATSGIGPDRADGPDTAGSDVPAADGAQAAQAAAAAEPDMDEPGTDSDAAPGAVRPGSAPSLADEMRAYYVARAPEYDDFYLRRGAYDGGPIHAMAWQSELDQATRWLDEQPISGAIVELAAGTGWWSPLLAQKGELWMYDVSNEPLSLARNRLLAHGLRAHLHLRDAWSEPDREVDVLFAGFWLSHVPRDRLAEFLGIARRWLRPGGRFVFIDSRLDPLASGPRSPEVSPGVQLRTLNDGRQFRVVKEFHEPDELTERLHGAGFATAEVGTTSRFFLLGRAVAA